ncbi:MAG: deoxyribose-phosphate aldolase [Desulfuromonadales bacterium]|jgi:deoxyribose-phosphate aldolase
MESPARYLDHTLLAADACEAAIVDLCEEAVEHGFASVCVPPVFVRNAARLLYGSEVAVGTVIGFPLGYQATSVKVYEVQDALAAGAGELDMVIQLGAARVQDYAAVGQEIVSVVEAAGSAPLKVIIECALFAADVKRRLTEIVAESGAAYVKTSTGFAAGGATAADVRLLAEAAAGRIGVKAAGGIRDWSTCRAMLDAGANRIGTSAGVQIMQQWQASLFS